MMTLEQDFEIRERRAEERGREAGLEAGEKKFASLTKRLIAANRLDDLQNAMTDKDYRVKLYLEFDID